MSPNTPENEFFTDADFVWAHFGLFGVFSRYLPSLKEKG
jgi:hypothetical protein